jgi:hypothetical protein
MNDLIITVPSPNVIDRSINDDECGSNKPILKIRYCGLTKRELYYQGKSTINLYNKESITLKPYEATIVNFDVTVITSLPATSILYGCSLMYRQGLSCIINLIPTNDHYLYVTIINKNPHSVQFKCDTLLFECNTILN